MKVILKQDVPNLGEEGDIKEVARGYARNFLLPRDMVLAYSKQNLAFIESKRKQIEKRKEEKRKSALGLKSRIEELNISLSVPAGENGKLFGSVNNATIADELKKLDLTIERKKIEVPENVIKMVGNYKVKIKLYNNEEAELKVSVTGAEAKEGVGTVEKEEVSPAADEAAPDTDAVVETEEETPTESTEE